MKILRYTLAVCLFITLNASAQKQEFHKNHKNYFGFGFGLGRGSETGLYSDAFLYLQRRNNYFKIKTSGISSIKLFEFSGLPKPSVSDVSLILGKSYTFNGYSYLQFGSGISLFNKISRGNFLYNDCDRAGGCLFSNNVYETIRQRPLAIPLEARLNLNLNRVYAVSFGLSANINKIQTFYAFSVGMILGRLRD